MKYTLLAAILVLWSHFPSTARSGDRWWGEMRGFPSWNQAPAAGSMLGVYLSDVTPELAESLGLPGEYGALVDDVIDGSPAAAAGVRGGDVIVGWNETRVESARQLQRIVGETPPGRRVRLRLVRDGSPMDLAVTTDSDRGPWGRAWPELPPGAAPFEEWHWPVAPPAMPPHRSGSRLGVAVIQLTDQLAEYFGLQKSTGVLVSSVLQDSPAARAGMRAGDILIAIDGNDIRSPQSIRSAIRSSEDRVTVTLFRSGRMLSVDVRLNHNRPDPGEGAFEPEPLRPRLPENEL